MRPRVALLSLLVAPAVLPAQRRPVLPQVRVPHSYYYRESYLPQVTTGPGTVGWSPDGRDLVYSMAGTLWRQSVGGILAVQLTDGPGYHYQPDWSPDGRWIAFVSYANDAMQLAVLDLATGSVRTLLDNGAVNVEPRWSPSGDRLAWVSTVHEGRWHVYLADVDGGALANVRRLTEDRDSGLPRYYYSAWDHYLSPSWSPGGREIMLVSNRGRIWGSGGFWRMEARPGAPMHEVHHEETTWRARPDWSRDGRRVAYSSYLGRQWNQLWLLSVDPAVRGATPTALHAPDAFQLTYGDFDATAPRWSPDATAIAYISNEGGNTTLKTVTVPGGEHREVVARERRYRNPTGTIRLIVTEAGREGALPARLSVRAADGRHFAPGDAWLHADDGFDRRQRRFEYAYFHANAAAEVIVPAGRVTIEAQRGIEYEPVTLDTTARTAAVTTVRLRLRRIDNPALRGWVSGDLHVHMNYGGTYRNTPERLARQARAEGLTVVENLIVNKEGRIPDVGYFSGRATMDKAGVLIAHDEEFHTSYWGHTGLLGLTRHLVLPNYAAYTNTAAASLSPSNSDVLRTAKAQGAVVGYVHPFDRYPDPDDTTRALTHALPVDAALGLVDYYEVVGFNDDPAAAQRVWYQLLNCGFRISAGGGTDAMANYASLRGPVGMNRVYARLNGPLTHRAFLDALASGRTFATNGPLLDFSLGGAGPGGELALPAGSHRLIATVRLRSPVPMDHLEVVRNGAVVAAIPLTGGRRSADARVTLTADSSGWYLLRARSNEARHPVLDVAAYGTTSPVYVIVDGRPIRSASDARYFSRWIDRLRREAEAFVEWNSAAERSATLELLDRARREFGQRAGPP